MYVRSVCKEAHTNRRFRSSRKTLDFAMFTYFFLICEGGYSSEHYAHTCTTLEDDWNTLHTQNHACMYLSQNYTKPCMYVLIWMCSCMYVCVYLKTTQSHAHMYVLIWICSCMYVLIPINTGTIYLLILCMYNLFIITLYLSLGLIHWSPKPPKFINTFGINTSIAEASKVWMHSLKILIQHNGN